jgi:hypothetical protein
VRDPHSVRQNRGVDIAAGLGINAADELDQLACHRLGVRAPPVDSFPNEKDGHGLSRISDARKSNVPASGHQPSQKRRRTGAALLQVCAILAEKIICSGYLAQQPIRLSQSLFIVESAGAIAHELVRQYVQLPPARILGRTERASKKISRSPNQRKRSSSRLWTMARRSSHRAS